MLFDHTDDGTIRAYGAIGYPEIDETMFMRALDEMGGQDITVRLQSEGGDVIAGLSIYNQLNNYPGQVTMEVDVLAASVASVLMMAADTINVTPVARIMVHRAWSIAFGNAADFRNTAELLESFDRTIAETYAERANGDADHWFNVMAQETWFTADEAVEAGLVDGITTGPATETVENRAELPPVAKIAASAGLGPAAQTMVRALKRKQKLLDNGSLVRNP